MGKFSSQLKGQTDRRNPIEGQAEPIKGKPALELFSLNFKYFDSTQGQSFSEWERDGLLSKAVDRWCQHSRKKLRQCFDSRFKPYDYFPPKSEFKHPKHVPPDAEWASMHIQGEECVVGHVHHNVFYVVFLDRHHKFWPTEKKNT
jgi:hypothetical protein